MRNSNTNEKRLKGGMSIQKCERRQKIIHENVCVFYCRFEKNTWNNFLQWDGASMWTRWIISAKSNRRKKMNQTITMQTGLRITACQEKMCDIFRKHSLIPRSRSKIEWGFKNVKSQMPNRREKMTTEKEKRPQYTKWLWKLSLVRRRCE